MSDSETYDTPRPTALSVNYDSPRPLSRSSFGNRLEDSYDVPRSVSILSQQMMTPSSSNSSLLLSTPDSHSISSSNRSSLANMPDYDIPRRHPSAMRTMTPLAAIIPTTSIQCTYDIPVPSQPKIQIKKELPLELSSALETLSKLQAEVTGAITK